MWFKSLAYQDGGILESGEITKKGGTRNFGDTTFMIGDNELNRKYRSILSFNTARLPDNAVITKVTIKIKKEGLVGTDPFTSHSGLKVDIRNPFFGKTSGLEIWDFQAGADKYGVATFGTKPVYNWYSANLNATGRSFVNLTGTTQFCLSFLKDDNDNMSAYFMKIFSGNYDTTSYRPTLIIEYTIP